MQRRARSAAVALASAEVPVMTPGLRARKEPADWGLGAWGNEQISKRIRLGYSEYHRRSNPCQKRNERWNTSERIAFMMPHPDIYWNLKGAIECVDMECELAKRGIKLTARDWGLVTPPRKDGKILLKCRMVTVMKEEKEEDEESELVTCSYVDGIGKM